MIKTSPRKSAKPAMTMEPVKQEMVPDPSIKFKSLIALLVVVVAGAGIYAYASTKNAASSVDSRLQPRQGVDQHALVATVSHVRSLVATNPDEPPTVAEIKNVDQLKSQNPLVYRDAQEGDDVLFWKDQIVIYSPSKDRIVLAMPLSIPTTSSTATTTTQPSSPQAPENATIEVRNGSPVPGTARTVAKTLISNGLNITAYNDAKRHDYAHVMILNASGKPLPQTLAKLKQLLGGEVVDSLPDEAKTKSDILVIATK